MAMITVAKPFTLQHDPLTRTVKDPMNPTKEIEETLPSRLQYFDVGVFEVEDHIAQHWYVRAHLKGYQEPPKGPGSAEFQMAQMQRPKPDGATPEAPTDPTQPMPPDATAPRQAALPPMVERAEPIA